MSDTILVVDDQANVRTLLTDYMKGQGYRVVSAGDGQTALFVARHEHPDVILLDIMMPHVSGLDILKALRTEEMLARIPVIILTASTDAATSGSTPTESAEPGAIEPSGTPSEKTATQAAREPATAPPEVTRPVLVLITVPRAPAALSPVYMFDTEPARPAPTRPVSGL